MICPNCKLGIIINLNGLFYECSRGCLEDTTLKMLLEDYQKRSLWKQAQRDSMKKG